MLDPRGVEKATQWVRFGRCFFLNIRVVNPGNWGKRLCALMASIKGMREREHCTMDPAFVFFGCLKKIRTAVKMLLNFLLNWMRFFFRWIFQEGPILRDLKGPPFEGCIKTQKFSGPPVGLALSKENLRHGHTLAPGMMMTWYYNDATHKPQRFPCHSLFQNDVVIST